jgi:transcriptional regulator with GAF, ATPase, and Fis domain
LSADNNQRNRSSKDVSTPPSGTVGELPFKSGIAAKEDEKTILLSLSNQIAAVRSRNDLSPVYDKLKELFNIKQFVIAHVSEDGKSYMAFKMDLGDGMKKQDDFEQVASATYSIDDPVFSAAVTSEQPVTFVVNELAKKPDAPAYVGLWKKAGIRKVVVIRLKVAVKIVGCAFLLTIPNAASTLKRNLLKSICAQISVAISNILANEENLRKEKEKTLLLSLSNEIAAVRNKHELLELLNAKLPGIFPIIGFGITLLNEDGNSHSPFVVDVDLKLRNEHFKEAVSLVYEVNDGVFNIIIGAQEPVTLQVDKLAKLPEAPAYVQYWKIMAVETVVGTPIQVGKKNLGCFILLNNPTCKTDISSLLLKGVSAQISVAISNISANEAIAKKEEEKTVLLSLSNEFAVLKNRNDLFEIVNIRIKKLFCIDEFAIAYISEDGASYAAFMLDLGDHIIRDPGFKDATSNSYDVNDALFSQVMASEDPIIFKVNELVDVAGMPAFVHFWKKVGLQLVLCAALRAGGKNIGGIFFHIDTNKTIDPKSILLKGVCAQLSVVVSNILSNESIKKSELEKSLLLSFSNSLATVRDKAGLKLIIKQFLKDIFHISEYIITTRNKDGETYSYFLHDALTKDPSDEGFKIMTSTRIPVRGAITGAVLQSEEPVIFVIEDIERTGKPFFPAASFWKGVGAKKIMGIRLRVAAEDFGVLLIQPDQVNDNLMKGISSQIAIAIANVTANEEIARRERERELLLSLNIDIAAVRSNDELLLVISNKLKNLVGFSHTVIFIINDDKMTAGVYLLDPQSKSRNHPDFPTHKTSKYIIDDGILNKVFNSSNPLIYDLPQLNEERILPLYFKINFESGMQKAVMMRFYKAGEVMGAWMIIFDKQVQLDASNLSLIEGLANQVSIALSNIIAIREIKDREQEKSRLLAFSNAIASVRDTVLLSKILTEQLKELFGIKEYAIHVLGEDKKTHRPILYDPEAEFARHPIFQAMIKQPTNVNDGIFTTILNSEDPITFDAEKWVDLPEPPVYANAAIDIGLKKLTGMRLRLGQENIAVWNFRRDGTTLTTGQYPLLKSICSQIAIALSNILAHEKVSNQLNEINKYKQQLEEEKIYLKEEIETTQHYGDIIGESAEIKKVFHMVAQVAGSDSTVLLLGETGTGKELIARAIHNSSPRKNKLMVKVNCATLPPNLIESELFGHERGSFTGATERRVGKFELANHGTLFLDEIGEMPLELQVKLLRALQEKEIERVGGSTTIKTDVRIVTATNRDLEKLMEEGRFRSDLYYRLNIFPIQLPPLRNRREDIPALASYFIARFAKKAGRKINTLSSKALQELTEYHWPGNIRELEHLIERSVLLSIGDTIKQIHLPRRETKLSAGSNHDVVIRTMDDNEREHILTVLKYCKGRIAGSGGAAELLDVPPSTLNSRMKRLGIKREYLG